MPGQHQVRLDLEKLDLEHHVHRVLLTLHDAGGKGGRHFGPVDRNRDSAHAFDSGGVNREGHRANFHAGQILGRHHRLVAGQVTAAKVMRIDHPHVGGGDQALVQLLHDRRIHIRHRHQVIDVAIQIRRVERGEGFIKRAERACSVMRKGDGAQRNGFGQFLQFAQLAGGVDIDLDVAVRRCAKRFGEPVGLSACNRGGLVVVAVTQNGLRTGTHR